jgi:hypothetical protein
MNQGNDAFKRLSEAAAAAGKSLREAGEAIMKAFEALLSAEIEDAIAELICKYPPDEALREMATAREWHLMNNAKKYRTRKKYKNRLIERYINDTQTERRNNA